VPARESGLVVPGDAKALAVLDLGWDGRPGFLVTRSNGTTLAFQSRGGARGRSLCVTLRGPAGNPTGIGARIRVECADGALQTGEIAAGSGHASQSAAAVFFGYGRSNPPVRAVVRWPDGATTAHAISGQPATLRLSPSSA
jgi:hypothetical protein